MGHISNIPKGQNQYFMNFYIETRTDGQYQSLYQPLTTYFDRDFSRYEISFYHWEISQSDLIEFVHYSWTLDVLTIKIHLKITPISRSIEYFHVFGYFPFSEFSCIPFHIPKNHYFTFRIHLHFTNNCPIAIHCHIQSMFSLRQKWKLIIESIPGTKHNE